jgi:hypothetical protein
MTDKIQRYSNDELIFHVENIRETIEEEGDLTGSNVLTEVIERLSDHIKAMEAKEHEIALLKQLVKDWENSATTKTIQAQAKEIERKNKHIKWLYRATDDAGWDQKDRDYRKMIIDCANRVTK